MPALVGFLRDISEFFQTRLKSVWQDFKLCVDPFQPLKCLFPIDAPHRIHKFLLAVKLSEGEADERHEELASLAVPERIHLAGGGGIRYCLAD